MLNDNSTKSNKQFFHRIFLETGVQREKEKYIYRNLNFPTDYLSAIRSVDPLKHA